MRVTDDGEGTLTVRLSGAIHFGNADGVLDLVREAMARARPSAVVVDLSTVEFLDSAGVAVLVVIRRLGAVTQARYRVVGAIPAVRAHLSLVGLAELLGVPQAPEPPEPGRRGPGDRTDRPGGGPHGPGGVDPTGG